jgi:hypothetical protein
MWRRFSRDNAVIFSAIAVAWAAGASCAPVAPPGSVFPTPQRHEIVRGPRPTRLAKPIANYTPAEFQQLVNRGNWMSGERANRPACETARCLEPTKGVVEPTKGVVTDLQIDAISDVANFDPNDAGDYGTVIARVTNRGRLPDFAFRSLPGSVVYLVVHRWEREDPGGHLARMQFVRLAGNTLTVVRPGEYRECLHHAPHDPGTPRVRFDGCEHPQYPRPAGMLRGPSASESGLMRGHTGDGQMECPLGCCESAAT